MAKCDKKEVAGYLMLYCFLFCGFLCIYALFTIISGSIYEANKHSLDYDMNVTLSSGDFVLIPYDQQHGYDSLIGLVIEISFASISSISTTAIVKVYQHTCGDISDNENTYMETTTTHRHGFTCDRRCEINTFMYFVNKEGSLLTYNVTDFEFYSGHSLARFVLFESYYKFMSFMSGDNEIPDREASISRNTIVTFDLSNMSAPSYVHVGLEILDTLAAGSTNNSHMSSDENSSDAGTTLVTLTLLSVAQQILYNVSQFDLACYFVSNTMSSTSCSHELAVFQVGDDHQRQCFIVHYTHDSAIVNVTVHVTPTESTIFSLIFVGGFIVSWGCFVLITFVLTCAVCIVNGIHKHLKLRRNSRYTKTTRNLNSRVDDIDSLLHLYIMPNKNKQSPAIVDQVKNLSSYPMLNLSYEQETKGVPLNDVLIQDSEMSVTEPGAVLSTNNEQLHFDSAAVQAHDDVIQVSNFDHTDGHSSETNEETTTCITESSNSASATTQIVENGQLIVQPTRFDCHSRSLIINEALLTSSAVQNSPLMSKKHQHYLPVTPFERGNNKFKIGTRKQNNGHDQYSYCTTAGSLPSFSLPAAKKLKDKPSAQDKIIRNPISSIQYQSIPFSEEGLFHHSHDYGITIIIPPGAVQGLATLQFGATLLLKDFKCDDPGLHPVSPFVWFHTGQVLCKPAELHIPHDVIVDTMDDVMGICLLTRSDEESSFKLNNKISMSIGSNITKLTSTHFCSLCLMANPVPKKRYHLVCAKKEFDDGTVHCDICVLYTFKCLQTFKIFHEGYEISNIAFPFAFEELKIVGEVHEDSGWQMTHREFEFSSIKESQIDFYAFLDIKPNTTVSQEDIEALKYYEAEGSYPPCFKLLFSPHPTIQPKSCHTKISLISEQETLVSVPIELKGERISSQQAELTDSAYGSYNANNGLHNDNGSSSILNELEKDSVVAISNKEQDQFLISILLFLESRLTANNWMKFGYHLGLSMTHMLKIEENVGHDIKRCIRQVLLFWSETSQDVSVKAIKEALQASDYHLLSAIVTDRFQNTTFCSLCQKTHGTMELNNCETALLNHFLNFSLNAVQEPTMTELSNLVVANIPAKWELFGVQLGVPQHVIDAIRKNNPGDCELCFIHLLNEWQRMRPSPYTWATVINVLYSPAFKEYLLAETIYAFIKQ